MSSIHKLAEDAEDFRVSSTIWSGQFLTKPTQKSLNQLLAFPNLHQDAKNQFIQFIHSRDTINFSVPWPNWPNSFLTMLMQKNFWSSFNLREFVSTCKKSGYFIDLFWRYAQLKNPAIWLAENIFVHISGTKISLIMRFVQKHSK